MASYGENLHIFQALASSIYITLSCVHYRLDPAWQAIQDLLFKKFLQVDTQSFIFYLIFFDLFFDLLIRHFWVPLTKWPVANLT